jgi:RND superfamily putative drug exporter
VLPTTASARQVDDALRTEFPPGRTSPLEVVAGAPAGSQQLSAFAERVRALPGVSAVAPAQPAGPDLSLLDVAPSASTYSAAAQRLVYQVRALRAPFYVGVSGETAAFIDLESSLERHLPLVLAVLIASTLIALFLMTGSVVLPVKAVLMNVLGLSAVFGILVLIFQHGSLEGLLSYRSNDALDASLPSRLRTDLIGRGNPPIALGASPSQRSVSQSAAQKCLTSRWLRGGSDIYRYDYISG